MFQIHATGRPANIFDVAAVIMRGHVVRDHFGGAVMKTMKLSTQPGTGNAIILSLPPLRQIRAQRKRREVDYSVLRKYSINLNTPNNKSAGRTKMKQILIRRISSDLKGIA